MWLPKRGSHDETDDVGAGGCGRPTGDSEWWTMSTTTTAPGPHVPPPRGPRGWALRRRGRLLAGLVVLVLPATAGAWASGAFSTQPGQATGVSDNGYPTSITTISEGALSSQTSTDGTLEYTTPGGSAYSVVNQASGTFSSLPQAGAVFSRGHVLYRVSNDPVILLYGHTPVYRALSEGDSGPDVRELNRNLVALGYATHSELDPASDYFSYQTRYALERAQQKLGEEQTGSLSEGQAVFLPGQARISNVDATLGTSARPASTIIQATSTSRQVLVNLDASEQSEIKIGDPAQITLPDGQTTPGATSNIGTVASSPASNASGSSASSPTLPVYIGLEHPQAAGNLDQALVTVEITTGEVKHALFVPVEALLALSGGGYAVETVGGHGVHKLVAITLGTFDDATGNVQITGEVQAGERIVVPNV
jgi:Putative peptidoglycan binding domain